MYVAYTVITWDIFHDYGTKSKRNGLESRVRTTGKQSKQKPIPENSWEQFTCIVINPHASPKAGQKYRAVR